MTLGQTLELVGDKKEMGKEQCGWMHGGMEECGMACLGEDKDSNWDEGGKFDLGKQGWGIRQVPC